VRERPGDRMPQVRRRCRLRSRIASDRSRLNVPTPGYRRSATRSLDTHAGRPLGISSACVVLRTCSTRAWRRGHNRGLRPCSSGRCTGGCV
jgi:hypothetical protein